MQQKSKEATLVKTRGISKMQLKVLAAGSVGQFIEFYDFALYGLSAVTLSQLFFPSGDELAGLLTLFATYGIAFFVRPLGGLLFGSLGDRFGRRTVLLSTLLLIGLSTSLMGALPTYADIGVAAPALLVLLRLLQGLSAGGESVGSPSFVYEHAPVHRRGLFINVTLAATALPSVAAATLLLLLSTALPEHLFQLWGWRVPFLIALPLAAFGLWIRKRTEESAVFKEVADVRLADGVKPRPVRESFRNNWLQMLQVVFVMGLTAMGFYFLSGYFVPYVATTGHLSREQSLLLNAAAMLSYTILLPVTGALSDRFGRRAMMRVGAVTIFVSALPAFLLVSSGILFLAFLGQLLFVVAITIYGGGCYTFFVEVFETKTRFTSAAFSYNTGYALFGGTAPFIGTLLVQNTGVDFSPAFWVMTVAVLTFVVMWFTRVPETRGYIT